MTAYVNLVWEDTATTGQGTINLGGARDGHMSAEDAGVLTGQEVPYILRDGSDKEYGIGTVTSGTPWTLSRDTVDQSIISGTVGTTKLNLSGSATVQITSRAIDIHGDGRHKALSGTTPTCDLGVYKSFSLSTTGNTTFTFSNYPPSGQVFIWDVEVTAGGTHTLTWPTVAWPDGTEPSGPASGETDIFTFRTRDGGTTIYGLQSVNAGS